MSNKMDRITEATFSVRMRVRLPSGSIRLSSASARRMEKVLKNAVNTSNICLEGKNVECIGVDMDFHD
jgi:hypothetical protein